VRRWSARVSGSLEGGDDSELHAVYGGGWSKGVEGRERKMGLVGSCAMQGPLDIVVTISSEEDGREQAPYHRDVVTRCIDDRPITRKRVFLGVWAARGPEHSNVEEHVSVLLRWRWPRGRSNLSMPVMAVLYVKLWRHDWCRSAAPWLLVASMVAPLLSVLAVPVWVGGMMPGLVSVVGIVRGSIPHRFGLFALVLLISASMYRHQTG